MSSVDESNPPIEPAIKHGDHSEDNLSDDSDLNRADKDRNFSDSEESSSSRSSCASLNSGGTSWKYNRKCETCDKIRFPCRKDPDHCFFGDWTEYLCYRKESERCQEESEESDPEKVQENQRDTDKEETKESYKICEKKRKMSL